MCYLFFMNSLRFELYTDRRITLRKVLHVFSVKPINLLPFRRYFDIGITSFRRRQSALLVDLSVYFLDLYSTASLPAGFDGSRFFRVDFNNDIIALQKAIGRKTFDTILFDLNVFKAYRSRLSHFFEFLNPDGQIIIPVEGSLFLSAWNDPANSEDPYIFHCACSLRCSYAD